MTKLTCLSVLVLALAATPLTLVDAHNPCPDQPTHTYALGPAPGAATPKSRSLIAPWAATVVDTNTSECDGNANTTADWDGDHDAGFGGVAFFGWGAWVDAPDCNYGLNHHGPSVAVNDLVFGPSIPYVIAQDDQWGPIKQSIYHPLTGAKLATVCLTNGIIAPGIDPDDCVTPIVMGPNVQCGTGGGDGGYWVILLSAPYTGPGGTLIVPNPYTTGTITAF